MAKRIGVAVVLAGLVLFLLVLLLWRDRLPFAGVTITPQPPAASQPAALPQTQPRQTSAQNDAAAASDPSADAIPLNTLDRALDSATSDIQVPEGIYSGQIPEDNALHWFLLAAEQLPTVSVPFDKLDNIIENGWQEDPAVIDMIEQCGPAFDAIRKGIAVGNIDYPPGGVDEPIPYAAKWRMLSRLMTIEAMMKASRGNSAAALNELADAYDFAAESTRNGFLILQLVGAAMQQYSVKPLCNILQSPSVTPGQCRTLIARLQTIQSRRQTMAQSVLSDAEMFEYTLQNDGSPEQLKGFLNLWAQYDSQAKNMAQNTTPEQCKVWFSQLPTAIRAAAPLLEVPVYQFDKKTLNPLVNTNPLAQHFMIGYDKFPETEARSQTLCCGPILVAAIETYHRETGAYPDSLDSLAPAVLPEIPNDPFTGAPFRYQLQGNRYKLYSAGTNMRDDAGRGKPWDIKQDDYVIAGQ